MEMKRRDLLEHVYQLVDGMRSMCQLLECPGIPPITGDILVVFECVYDEVLRLVEEAMKLDDKDRSYMQKIIISIMSTIVIIWNELRDRDGKNKNE